MVCDFKKKKNVCLKISVVTKELDLVKDTWLTQGVFVISDGWSNVKSEPRINVIAQNSRGATFMYDDAFSGIEKTEVEIAKFLRQAIDEIGPSSVIQVVTDNAANSKAVGREIQKEYKHIFWPPCCVHSLNLIFKDMVKQFEWLSDTYNRGKGIVTQLEIAIVEGCTNMICIALHICTEALATTIVVNSWREWVNKVDEQTRDDIAHILVVTKSIIYMVNFCDGEGLKMAEIYERMDNMMGFVLNPNYYDKHYLAKLAPGGMKRNPPNEEREVIVESVEEEKQLREQFAIFHTKKGIYSLPGTQADAVTIDAIDSWATYGAETPDLADMAK
uniref:DUF659 domain-containing protein n=1 Tax=Lactuca sativa TaxID=4236 RepID=A0A9R1W3L6_LACSA|nr:hypothetical protein LSAT_V11C300148030 [Lactuca sativa]